MNVPMLVRTAAVKGWLAEIAEQDYLRKEG